MLVDVYVEIPGYSCGIMTHHPLPIPSSSGEPEPKHLKDARVLHDRSSSRQSKVSYYSTSISKTGGLSSFGFVRVSINE